MLAWLAVLIVADCGVVGMLAATLAAEPSIGEQIDLATKATLSSGLAPPRFEYNAHSGYLPSGADLLNGSMTVGAAERLCDTLSECLGFTFSVVDGEPGEKKTLAWLKTSDEWVPHADHRTHLKDRPACKVQYMRYQKAGHGPYCCKGAACPADGSSAHVLLESRCQLPGASPLGVPRCSALRRGLS